MKGIGLVGQIIHWAIIALCLYTVFCCGFHLLPVWGYTENYESINATLLSIALSYLAGYVIYFIHIMVTKMAERKRGVCFMVRASVKAI